MFPIALLALLPAFPVVPIEGADPPEVVVFYLIDTCRADRLGFLGHDRGTTPFLDRLAARSVVFERCYSQAPWTKPSMAAILTGDPPGRHGVTELFQRLPDSEVTFPELLRDAGYYTSGFSANPIMGRMSNYNQGFLRFVESAMVNGADPIDRASGSARILNDLVFEWLDQNRPRPLFLYVHSVDPHEEYEPDARFREGLVDDSMEEKYRADWKALLESRPPIPGNHVTQRNFDRTGVDVHEFIAHGLDLYDADIRANDHEIERLFERLSRECDPEDLVFVLTADHGEEFFEHGGTSHGYTLYREMLHVPLLIHAPGRLPEGRRVFNAVRSIDVFPTVLDLLGVPAKPDAEGRSLLPLVRDPNSYVDPPVFSEKTEDEITRKLGESAGVAISLTRGRYKLIVNFRSPPYEELPRYELYDLKEDPLETRNLAEDRPDLVRELEREVLRYAGENAARNAARERVDIEDLPPEILKRLRELGYVSGG